MAGTAKIKSVNLKADRPTVEQALQRLEREIVVAGQQNLRLLKLIHGYGSSGVGGDIRLAVQARLQAMLEQGQIQACIFGEDWGQSDERTWKLLQSRPELKNDADLGHRNRGITIVAL